MKNQVLFYLKDKCKNLKCCLLQFLFGTLGVNLSVHNELLCFIRTCWLHVFLCIMCYCAL